MHVSADTRTITWQPRHELAAKVVALRGPFTESLLELAKSFAALEESAHFITDNCSSIAEWAAKKGFSGAMAFRLAQVGRALRSQP